MNTVLTQEAEKYNILIKVMKKDLRLFQRGLKGEIIMDETLEVMGQSILSNSVPKNWTEE